MQILSADFLLTYDESLNILQNKAVVFNEKILNICDEEQALRTYPDAKFTRLEKNSILMPGLINPHVHLEFSANKSILTYGSFVPWLKSVIKNRDEIMELSTAKTMSKALNKMTQAGTTSIGAISSQGFDLFPCVQSPLKVVYFNEILGSNPAAVDAMFSDFQSRLKGSLDEKSSTFIPAVSVHSPYSTHPILAKKALQIAKEHDFLVSTHFLESFAEKQWLESGCGDFVDFFAPFNPHAKPFLKPLEYVELFKDVKSLFTHCCYATEQELDAISKLDTSITHCPRSNRLLDSQSLDLQKLLERNISLSLGTDGLSSNNSLSLWDEMRTALFLHEGIKLESLANELLKSVTVNGAKALGLESGKIQKGLSADMIVVNLEQIPKDLNQLPLQLILHTKKVHKIFVEGKDIL